MENQEEVISIGVSPVTPAQIFMDLWPKIQQYCPELKLKIVPFENTPENAREILGNLGQGIDVVAGALVHNCGSVLVIVNSALLLKWRWK